MTDLLSRLTFSRGPDMKNRFMLAPLTNCQSHPDGTLSDDEFHWLTKRSKGGFGLTMTCAAHVQANGQGFPGQLGIWDDKHIEGLTRLANAIKAEDSVAIVQLHHAGMRSPADLIGETPVSASDNERAGARALTSAEVEQVVEDFVRAAERAEQAGFDGVELHGAHGYLLCQFFSTRTNQREDAWGGNLNRRYHILFEIIDGIRERCREDFCLGVRLSPERFGLQTEEVMAMAQRLMQEDDIDFLDMSLWDSFKAPEDPAYAGQTLAELFAGLDRGRVRLGIAGNIRTPEQAEAAMATGVDWIMLGRAAMYDHAFPNQYAADKRFEPTPLPVTQAHLRSEGLSQSFVEYVKSNWPETIAD